MRKNEYTSLQEFREEYDGLRYKKHRSFIGIEFTYHNVYYRMCREPVRDEYLPTLPNGRKGHYHVVIVHWKNGEWFSDFEYELIGWYETIDDLLHECHIEGKTFEDVIMADETEIIGKD